MDRQELLEHLLKTFLLELDEHLAVLSRGLLQLEAGAAGEARAATLDDLFRAAHSLKGAARAVEQPLIANLCHAMETTLGELRRGALEPSAAIFSLLFGCVDALDDAARGAQGTPNLDQPHFEALTEALKTAAAGGAFQTPAPPEVVPEPEPQVSLPPSDARTRVSLGRLDALLANTGELMVARRRVRSDAEALLELAEQVSVAGRAHRTAEARARGMLEELRELHPAAAECLANLGRARSALAGAERTLELMALQLRADVQGLERVAEPFEHQVRQLRMLPFRELEPLLERAVRDAAQASGKRARLELVGKDVEADRAVLDGLKDALVHLVRNAVVHGIEDPADRAAAGKPPEGLVRVKATLRGSNVSLSVEDDGRGIDRPAVREKARALGMSIPETDRELVRLVFLPQLSTATSVSQSAGRGIGLDVVLNQVEALHGSVEIFSGSGTGTRFSMLLPLTLTSLRALLVEAGGTPFALAASNVLRLLRIGSDDVRQMEGRDMLSHEDELIPVMELTRALGMEAPRRPFPARRPAVVVAGGERKVALVVDELLSEREVVVKSLGPRLRAVRHVAGGTLLDSGQVALLLNAAELVRTAQRPARDGAVRFAGEVASRKGVVLVADDSVTTRSLMRSVLIGAGYQVLSAPDGRDAWEQLQRAAVDLVVADVEMPHMDGVTLTEHIRGSTRLRSLPVVLVTGLGGEADRARGLAAGASAYVVKGSFDQRELLAAVDRLVSA